MKNSVIQPDLPNPFKMTLKIILSIVLVLSFIFGISLWSEFRNISRNSNISSALYQNVKESYPQSDLVLLDRNGKQLTRFRKNTQFRNRPWLNLQEASPTFIQALVQTEDKRFYHHHGVDFFALAKATISWAFQG